MSTGIRTTVLWVPDWSVVAAMTQASLSSHIPAAVHDGRQVVATSTGARSAGVRRGMRKRHAQSVCPDLALLTADPIRDIYAFEQVTIAAELVVAGVEVVRPGLLLLPAGGAVRYHGSEELLASRLIDAVADRCGYECGVGTADGLLAAILAARTTTVVPRDTSEDFLSERSINELVIATVDEKQSDEVRKLIDLLIRLGIRTIGAFAALPASDVLARFGRIGVWAHTMANGQDLRPPALRRPEQDLVVCESVDPPVTRIDQASFVGRRLADRLHAMVAEKGLSCGRLQISARTDIGTELTRIWRVGGASGDATPARITDRVRWQLEGWLSRGGDVDDRSLGLVQFEIIALDVVAAGKHQGGLWGAPSGADIRAHRALERVQHLIGADKVLVCDLQGGRTLTDQIHLTTWNRAEPPDRSLEPPWPGRIPDPMPSLVSSHPRLVDLRTTAGAAVRITRGLLEASPAFLDTGDGPRPVLGWAGPWPVPPRWWHTGESDWSAHLQILCDTGQVVLLTGAETWTWVGTYD